MQFKVLAKNTMIASMLSFLFISTGNSKTPTVEEQKATHQRKELITRLLAQKESCESGAQASAPVHDIKKASVSINKVINQPFLGLRYEGVSLLSDEQLIDLINTHNGDHKLLEVGAASKPVCRGEHCVFIDVNLESLQDTKMASEKISPDAHFIHTPAHSIAEVKSHTIKKIVSKCFPWRVEEAEPIIAEYQRLLLGDGMVVIYCDGAGTKWREHSEVWLREPISAAQKLGFSVEFIATPLHDGIILRPKS